MSFKLGDFVVTDNGTVWMVSPPYTPLRPTHMDDVFLRSVVRDDTGWFDPAQLRKATPEEVKRAMRMLHLETAKQIGWCILCIGVMLVIVSQCSTS